MFNLETRTLHILCPKPWKQEVLSPRGQCLLLAESSSDIGRATKLVREVQQVVLAQNRSMAVVFKVSGIPGFGGEGLGW